MSSSDLQLEEPDDIDYAAKYLSKWSGFHKKTLIERQKAVNNEFNECCSLPLDIADSMIENCIGTLCLPLGICPNFVINGRHFVVPYCIEEPSVIAAASSISKLIAQNGGFYATNSIRNVMNGQIQIYHGQTTKSENIENAMNVIRENKVKYLKRANAEFCANMCQRGGGMIDLNLRRICNEYFCADLSVDVCEVMGANKINSICEGVSVWMLSDLKDAGFKSANIGLCILSNLCLQRMCLAAFCVPLSAMSWKGMNGEFVANKIMNANEFGKKDIFRAATNNKGIMNGMDAVSIALGQDWRAIEAAAHSFASFDKCSSYQSLANYFIAHSKKRKCLCLFDSLKIPISVGSKGGAIDTHPAYKWIFKHLLGGNVNAKNIANIIVCAGLASNFAALRALAVEGIQKGHMKLHKKKKKIKKQMDNNDNNEKHDALSLLNDVISTLTKSKGTQSKI